jgi:hypothetical protein
MTGSNEVRKFCEGKSMPRLRETQLPDQHAPWRPAGGSLWPVVVRLGLLVFAGVLALQSFWLLAVDITRPQVPYFVSPNLQVSPGQQRRALDAAEIGWARGDLWLDDAIVLGSKLGLAGNGGDAPAAPAIENTRAAARRAAELAPHQARAWLLLAALEAHSGVQVRPEILQMTYYTGANDEALIPFRINLVARSAAISDRDLQLLVGNEIQTMLSRAKLRSALIDAYKSATPEAKAFIGAKIRALDPGLFIAIK